jgi:uncharacterized protein (DUF1778 family)
MEEHSAPPSVKEQVAEVLDEESFKEFKAALENPGYPTTVIVKALKSFGIRVSETSVRRWRTSGWDSVK